MSILITSTLLFIACLIVSYILVGKVRDVVIYKELLDSPNVRSSHEVSTPNLGGMAFYIVLMLSFYFTAPYDKSGTLMSIIPGLTILFTIGLKDDLVVLSPLTKLIAQIVAALFLVFHFKLNLKTLHGFMGIENIPAYVAAPIGVLIIVSIINSINLIDGIDGLASTVGIIMFSVFAYLFYLAANYFLMMTCIAMIGTLLAFLRFNLSPTKKIFMGDTGSMIVGFMLGLMAVRLMALDITQLQKLPFYFENIPFVVAAILIIPLFDTVRVFTLRLLKKKSPFSPDRSHIHHVIIDRFNISHRRASFYIGVANFVIVMLFSFLAMRTTQWQLLAIFLHVIFAAVVFFFVINKPRILRKMKIMSKRKLRAKVDPLKE
jgi:UDP-GlcNAc:undecaprenyl-phosphate/decaprenyl-phosphate GlcNAc-1-phosphate transferase